MARDLRVGYPGAATIYAIIRRVADDLVWNVTNEAWETWVDGTLASYDIPLTDRSGDYHSIDFPGGIARGTKVHITYYVQAGAAPALTDYIQQRQSALWMGAISEEALGAGVSTRSWIALTDLQALPNIPSSFTDDVLVQVINGVIDAIETFCKRHFIEDDYFVWLNGRGCKNLWLPNYPITEVRRLAASRTSVLNVKYENTSAAWATIRATATGITLKSSVAGVATTNTLLYADYATLTLLAAAINTVSGWTATLLSSSYGIRETTEIRPHEAMFCLDVSVSLGMPYTYLDSYEVEAANGRVALPLTIFPKGFGNVFIDYTGGYELADIPAELTTAALSLCRLVFAYLDSDPDIKSHRLGDEAWTRGVELFALGAIQGRIAEMLSHYRSPTA